MTRNYAGRCSVGLTKFIHNDFEKKKKKHFSSFDFVQWKPLNACVCIGNKSALWKWNFAKTNEITESILKKTAFVSRESLTIAFTITFFFFVYTYAAVPMTMRTIAKVLCKSPMFNNETNIWGETTFTIFTCEHGFYFFMKRRMWFGIPILTFCMFVVPVSILSLRSDNSDNNKFNVEISFLFFWIQNHCIHVRMCMWAANRMCYQWFHDFI